MSSPERQPDPDSRFELLDGPVAPGLEPFVIRIAGYRDLGTTPMEMLEIASLIVPLVIGFDAPFEIALGRDPLPEDRYASFTAGLYAGPVRIRSAGGANCIQVNFTPLGARRFFGMPMHELADRMVRLDDLGDRALAALRQRLGEEPRWDDRFALVDRFLRARLLASPAPSAATGWAYDALMASGGRMSVTSIAGRLDWSRKHLAAKFRDEIGLPPKTVARIARFERARRLAASGSERGWADVAATCGYADQAHLVREFREFSGLSPTAWLAA